jgi:RNA polymerase sigma-70 factor (ECF subfamily)|nr:sigma-70 family RNA polymerase sigma factor [uncultured Blautia sp.]
MTKDVFIREIRKSEAMLYHVAKSILKNDSDCGDAVQETLLKAYEKLHTLKQDQFFRTWITRILINECNGILRKKKHMISYEEYMQETRVFEEKKYTHLYMAILELPEELRILVTLYYIEGFSQKEIAEILGMQEGTIKSRLSRARRLLREILTEADACSRSKETKGGTRLQLR